MCICALRCVCVREGYCILLCGNFVELQCTESEESCEESRGPVSGRKNLSDAQRGGMKDECKHCLFLSFTAGVGSILHCANKVFH